VEDTEAHNQHPSAEPTRQQFSGHKGNYRYLAGSSHPASFGQPTIRLSGACSIFTFYMLSHTARPGFIEPCLPFPADHPPSGSGWIHEIKHDGYRLMARRDAVGIRLITRRGND
jgi:ATP-dependent DNA ligase